MRAEPKLKLEQIIYLIECGNLGHFEVQGMTLSDDKETYYYRFRDTHISWTDEKEIFNKSDEKRHWFLDIDEAFKFLKEQMK
jgi:hypothetical protein